MNELLAMWVKVLRHIWPLVDDVRVDSVGLGVIPGWVACKHLEDDYTQSPPVNFFRVPL